MKSLTWNDMSTILKHKMIYSIFALFLAVCALPDAAFATAVDWQLGFQKPASPVMEALDGFHDLLMVIITAITIFVLVLIAYICIRFHHKRNPVASKTSHNTVIEIIWTALPVLILLVIAVPSVKLLYFAEQEITPELTLKVTGYQWYWGYEFPDYDHYNFESVLKQDNELAPGELRLLTVDNPLVLPVHTKVRVLVTAADVIHDWAVPQFGIKIDAVPGRVNQIWFEINEPGTYYGQCSELCGTNHGYMPIQIKAVSKEEFAAWMSEKIGKPVAVIGSEVSEAPAAEAQAVEAESADKTENNEAPTGAQAL